ncbi:recombinase family protein, partial [Mesorhizobium sp. M2A.F.Ca.ET.037.01.1.1]|uniref:recombinase family protein n=1 Tax=Mesorhizobium sp. M2A.F.Ca.ET.037.01.1.1 TaxID=2496748 RepID=UPI001AECEB96
MSYAFLFPPDWRMVARARSFSIPMSKCRQGSAVFAKFRELHSARAVMRYLRKNGLPLPVRPLLGPAPHDVVWREADSSRVLSILQNPAYAGAYVYGRRRVDGGRIAMAFIARRRSRSPS